MPLWIEIMCRLMSLCLAYAMSILIYNGIFFFVVYAYKFKLGYETSVVESGSVAGVAGDVCRLFG